MTVPESVRAAGLSTWGLGSRQGSSSSLVSVAARRAEGLRMLPKRTLALRSAEPKRPGDLAGAVCGRWTVGPTSSAGMRSPRKRCSLATRRRRSSRSLACSTTAPHGVEASKTLGVLSMASGDVKVSVPSNSDDEGGSSSLKKL